MFRSVCALAALGILTSNPACAVDDGILDLSGAWRYYNGDSLEFATPDFDVDGWGEEQLPLPPDGGFEEHRTPFLWFRLTVDVPSALRGQRLGLSLPIDTYHQVFANGRLVAPEGSEPPGGTRMPEDAADPDFNIFDLGTVPAGTTTLTLAVRTWVPPAFVNYAGSRFHGGPLLLGMLPTVSVIAAAKQREQRVSETLVDILVAILYGLVALFHLGLYLRRRHEYAYLWYALTLVSLALWRTMKVAEVQFGLGIESALPSQLALGKYTVASRLAPVRS